MRVYTLICEPMLMGQCMAKLVCRALAAPAVMIMSVSQGACLGQQDAWTPAGVLAAAGLLNAGQQFRCVCHTVL